MIFDAGTGRINAQRMSSLPRHRLIFFCIFHSGVDDHESNERPCRS